MAPIHKSTGRHTQVQVEDDDKNDLKKLKVVNGQTWSKIDISGRELLRKPRLSESCSAD